MKTSSRLSVILIALSIVCANPLSAQTQWDMLGPFGGVVHAIASDGKEYVYADIEATGMFRSSNEGKTWEAINNGLPSTGIYFITIAPDGRLFCGGYNFLAVSSDHGSSWTCNRTWGSEKVVARAAVLPDSQIILSFDNIISNELIRSSDNGATWKKITGIPDRDFIFSLTNGPGNSFLVGSGGHGLYQLFPDADTLVSITYNLPQIIVGPNKYDDCRGLVVLDDGSILLPYSDKLLILPAGTKSWTMLSSWYQSHSLLKISDSLIYGYDGWILTVSKDRGKTWTEFPEPGRNTWGFAVMHNTFICSRDQNIWRSEDNGNNWIESIYGIARTDINCVLLTSSQSILIGTSRSGILASADNGEHWSKMSLPTPQGSQDCIVTLKKNSRNTLFAATTGSSNCVWRSRTDGEAWEVTMLRDSSWSGGVSRQITDMSINQKDELFVSALAGGNDALSGIFKSSDEGDTWTQLFSAPANTGARSFLLIGDSVVLMGTYNRGIYRSTNLGATWAPAEGTTGFNEIVSIVSDSGAIVLAASRGSGVLRSADHGQSWTQSNDGLGNLFVRTISRLPNGMLFAGTERGGFVSQDHGQSWQGVTSADRISTVRSIFAEAGSPYYLTTDAGVFRTSALVATSSPEETNPNTPNQFVLFPNYPNPFNPSTTIAFGLPSRSYVSLKIYDVMGKEVSTLVSEELPAGNYRRQWNAVGCPSGVYFYRLQAGAHMETKRLVVLK